jgi:lipopolysaccharide transport system ATP-binding protein
VSDLEFKQVSKKYLIRSAASRNVSSVQRLWQRVRRRSDFWALRDVTFSVQRGEALGIIGHNGAGKSTILKLLSNITTPTFGEIAIEGRLAALIEIGSGFHPELTGRENVYLNGALLGMRRREITAKLDSIVEFAGVQQFIDVPVKRYSSGMYLRLGFSIAAHLDPDILLLDEVLAVGDATFQAKCLDRVTELKRAGTTIVFISHNLHAVARLCERTLLLSRGEILSDGPTNDVIAEYERRLSSLTPSTPHGEPLITDPRAVEIISLSFYDSQNRKTTSFQTGESLRAVIEYKVNEPIEDAIVEVYFYSIFGNMHCHFTTAAKGERLSLTHGVGAVEFFCAAVALEAATFNVDVGVKRTSSLSSEFVDCKRAAVLNVTVGRPVLGVFYMPHTWTMRNTDSSNQQHGENTIYEILPLKN